MTKQEMIDQITIEIQNLEDIIAKPESNRDQRWYSLGVATSRIMTIFEDSETEIIDEEKIRRLVTEFSLIDDMPPSTSGALKDYVVELVKKGELP